MPDTWEQFRIHGRAEVVDSGHASAELLQVSARRTLALAPHQAVNAPRFAGPRLRRNCLNYALAISCLGVSMQVILQDYSR